MPKIKLEIEMDVQPMNKEELLASGMDDETADKFVGAGIEEYEANEIAECLVSVLNNEESVREGFAGSNIFVTVADAKLVSSDIEEI